jgi:hypothetical protein
MSASACCRPAPFPESVGMVGGDTFMSPFFELHREGRRAGQGAATDIVHGLRE